MARRKAELRQLLPVPVEHVTRPKDAPPPPGEQAVVEATEAIQARGEAPPPLVRDEGRGNYTLIVGDLALEAARRLGWGEIDCIVVDGDCDAELRVIQGMQKNEADPWDLADALHGLKSRYGWTQAQLGGAIGRTRDFVANTLALKQIVPEVRKFIFRHERGDDLTVRHLRYVARSPRPEQMRLARRILDHTPTTKELEREQRHGVGRVPRTNLIRTRPLRRAGSASFPRTPKDWRRYHRQLMTDLRRVERQEALEQRRAQALLAEAKQRAKQVRIEAGTKRKELNRELRIVKRQILRLGS